VTAVESLTAAGRLVYSLIRLTVAHPLSSVDVALFVLLLFASRRVGCREWAKPDR